jgi:2-polyprenyl-6-methoxyphenol hydroxylase-like FAD-dependent oxidoreductase
VPSRVERRALIVGGGIGGLAAGRALREAGFETRILERTSSLDSLGTGISIWPNGVRALRDLCAADALPTNAEPPPNSGIHDWKGRPLIATDLAKIRRRYGAPMLFLQRATLHAALLSDGIAELVETDAEAVRVEPLSDRVRVWLASGESLEADVLIGADGIHSKVRAELLGDGPPQPSGLLAYRGMVDLPLADLAAGEYWGEGRIFGLFQVDGGSLCWWATRSTGGNEPHEPDPRPELLAQHRSWAPGIAELIAATSPDAIMRHYLFDRTPARRWVTTRMALLGDAAHPMLPFLGQGACQALEDAQALRRAFKQSSDIPIALRAYQDHRRRRAAHIVRGSRRMGRLAHLRASPLRVARDRVMANTPERVRMRQLDQIVGRPAR